MINSIKVLVASVLIVALTGSSASAAYAPNRPVYKWNQNAKDITFDSVTNNPAVGDERSFLLVRNATDNNYVDQLKVADNQEVVFQIYYHNNAASNKVAKNSKVQAILPAYNAKSLTVNAYISADNSKPGTVADTAQLVADQPFSLEYEKGSSKIWNNVLRGKSLSDDLATQQQGAQIGYKQLDGKIAGGSQYSGYVTFKAKVHMPKTVASTKSVGVVNGVPNTGPGEVVGLFAGATALGTATHLVVSRRARR